MSLKKIKDLKHESFIWVSDCYEEALQSRKVLCSTKGSWLLWYNMDTEKTQKRLSLELRTNPYDDAYVLIYDPIHLTYLWVCDKYQPLKEARQVLASTKESWMQFYGNDQKKVNDRLSFKIESFQDNFFHIKDKKYETFLWVVDVEYAPGSRFLYASSKQSWAQWYKGNQVQANARLLFVMQ